MLKENVNTIVNTIQRLIMRFNAKRAKSHAQLHMHMHMITTQNHVLPFTHDSAMLEVPRDWGKGHEQSGSRPGSTTPITQMSCFHFS